MTNHYYKKREAFFIQGLVLFIGWIAYIFLDEYMSGGFRGSLIEGKSWVRDAYIHLNSHVLVVGSICLIIEIVGCILGMLSRSCITLTDNKVYGKSSFIYRLNISLGDIKEVRFLERFNTLEIVHADSSTKLLFMKSGNELKVKIDEAVYRYNNLDGKYQETRFSDEKGKPVWKLILSAVWNAFLIYLAYVYLFAVPDVNGLNLKDAEKELTRRGIPYTKVAEFPTFTLYDKGDVCDDGGAAHRPIVSAGTVVLTYIGGVTEEELNGLIGKTLEDASKVLTNAGCVGYYTEVYSETVPEGTIITWKENSENSYTMIVSLGKEPAKNTGSSAGDQSYSWNNSNSDVKWDVEMVANREENNTTSAYNSFSSYFSWYVHFICDCNVSTAQGSFKYTITGSNGDEYEDTIDVVEAGDVWNLEIPENTFKAGEDVVITAYMDGKEVSSYDVWISYN